MTGTPKTLMEAIDNGIKDSNGNDATPFIREHVVDFLAQKFGTSMLQTEDPEVRKLWQAIIKIEE